MAACVAAVREGALVAMKLSEAKVGSVVRVLFYGEGDDGPTGYIGKILKVSKLFVHVELEDGSRWPCELNELELVK